MASLDDKIKSYYQSRSLPEAQVERLLEQTQGKPRLQRYYWLAGCAAVLLVGLVWWSGRGRDPADRVLAEVAMNHVKGLAVEVTADHYGALQEGLDKLDFVVLPPPDICDQYALVGGRYCSILGGLAAQLKVRDADSDQMLTLYVTRNTDELRRIGYREAQWEGVEVSMWGADNRFFALARDRE
ncbi:MAG: hypothetical protein GKR89_24480 [Candidatus Latescibacteria bacterium]|nr:hypothetical protein [Candidatus Latescibacterota bacterium]